MVTGPNGVFKASIYPEKNFCLKVFTVSKDNSVKFKKLRRI